METERLYIRRYTKEDFPGICELIRDKMASPYAKYDSAFPTDDKGLMEVLNFFAGSDEFWALEEKSEHKIIGFISLNYVDEASRNLGYCLHTRWHGKGHASEAARRMIKYAKEELKLEKLVTGTAEENLPSVKLLERLGFTRLCEGSFELCFR